MQHVFNAYVTKVLEAMVGPEMTMKQAKQVCRSKLQFIEESYLGLSDIGVVAASLKTY